MRISLSQSIKELVKRGKTFQQVCAIHKTVPTNTIARIFKSLDLDYQLPQDILVTDPDKIKNTLLDRVLPNIDIKGDKFIVYEETPLVYLLYRAKSKFNSDIWKLYDKEDKCKGYLNKNKTYGKVKLGYNSYQIKFIDGKLILEK